MNRREVKRAPVLRFKGFTNDWEQHTLGDFGSVAMNKRIFKNQTTDKGGVPFFKISTFGKKADSFISNNLFEKYKEKYPYPQKGDLLISASGSIGRIVEYKGQKAYYQDSNIVWLNHNKELLNIYLKAYYQIIHWHGIEGSTIKRLYNKNILATSIFVPDKKEQYELGKLIKKAEKIISLQQRKLELLSLIKKTIIKHLFKLKNSDSLNLKFKTSCSQWNSKKLGEIAKFINGRAFKQSELLNKGKYPVLRVGNFYTNDKWFYSDLNLNKNKYADKGDLLYTWSATFGPHIWKGPKVIFHYHIWKIDFDPSTVNKTFLFYFLEADKENLLTNSNGSTMIHITKSNMENKIINLPQFSIQQNIGTFLSNLDYLINQEKIKSKQLIQLKRFLLQNMFI